MGEEEKKDKLTFHYIKSSNFTMNQIDGVFGGITPNGKIGMTFFSERFPIPRSVTHEVVDNQLGEEIGRDSKEGSIRQVDCGILLNLKTAKVLYNWLENKIKDLEEITKPVKEMENGINQDKNNSGE